mmetsp:Transcript_27555/g.64300  ORF Transcript_27555/g.64300 Transcript_27555/m.64300 type:complete len:202 (-) Transcript_27555:312-917(-)
MRSLLGGHPALGLVGEHALKARPHVARDGDCLPKELEIRLEHRIEAERSDVGARNGARILIIPGGDDTRWRFRLEAAWPHDAVLEVGARRRDHRLLRVLVGHYAGHHRHHEQPECPRRLIHRISGADGRDDGDALHAVLLARRHDIRCPVLQHRRPHVARLAAKCNDHAGDVLPGKDSIDVTPRGDASLRHCELLRTCRRQ